MAEQEQNCLPQVLVLGTPPPGFSILRSQYSHKFHFLSFFKPSELSLHQFLASHHRCDPSSILAILCGAQDPVAGEVLRLLPSLGVVVTTSAGTNHIDLAECRRRGILVAGAGGAYSEDVADVAVGLLIDVFRKISAANRCFLMKSRMQFTPGDLLLGSKVGGKRVGIIGLGSIGLKTAKRLEAFGCIITYHSRNRKPSIPYPFYPNILDLALASDALVLCCALNEQTKHIVNKEVMVALGKEGIIVNVGRGGLIDEEEMVKCLVGGEIGGAGLDVYENEPLVPQELFDLDNVVLYPHSAAFTSESIVGVVEVVVQNLEAFFSNKSLVTPPTDRGMCSAFSSS
ncbi:glyoxylate/hydroxypyruvate reductase HPR3-like [Senna tora]|uniref:glyoxylate reductase (NADP(+)) n=1 Tax=Senna tora TaxID=362788 RepID=A0A834XHU8_9FABA|nr:glyoxylate/hydroxypyruvate reductase HPR3-like [Senna tora]